MVLECASSGGHDAQVLRLGIIVLFLVVLELAHKFYTCVDAIRLELEKVQPPARRIVARFARKVYEFCKGASNLPGRISMLLLTLLLGGRRGKNATAHGRVPGATTSKESRRNTHINGYMAHDGRVVGQPNVVGIVLVVFAFRGIRLLLVDYESALNIDAHAARVLDGILDIALGSSPPGTSEVRGRGDLYGLRTRCLGAGFTRRGVQCRRHGDGCFGSWQ